MHSIHAPPCSTTSVAADKATGLHKLSTNAHGVRMPASSGELRLRFRTLGAVTVYLKLRSQRAVLLAADISLFDRYFEFLTGPEAWGRVTMD